VGGPHKREARVNDEMRAMLTGGGVVLGLVVGVAGVWSMTKAPDPPAVADARKEEKAARTLVVNNMHEFMTHYRRANQDMEKGAPKERILAHLSIMTEFSEEMASNRGHEVPPEQLKALRQQLDNCANAVDNAWPSARQELADLKRTCVNCHEMQKKGPTGDEMFPPPLKP
jgi:hypothetical protein